ncbi:MAG TPA: DUF1223 domain-containing protein [Terracidiphilus sp.]|nr:DUF1223 domain-containing protein [Terracidiphilus sp.]
MAELSSSFAGWVRVALWVLVGAALAIPFVFGQEGTKPPGSRQPVLSRKLQGRPVLVELFTSEGCSDCPPADALLARLDREQFVRGADAIVLSEHVTYWNHDGWADPFSMEENDERQQEYVDRFHLDSSYTPQAVVDGSLQFVGNNAGAMEQAVQQAAGAAKEPLTIENAHWEKGGVAFTVRTQAGPGAELEAALAENATHRTVTAGENAGRVLHHVSVVRVMKNFGSKAFDGRVLRLADGGLIHGEDAKVPVRLVVFVADRKTGHILAVAEQTLAR